MNKKSFKLSLLALALAFAAIVAFGVFALIAFNGGAVAPVSSAVRAKEVLQAGNTVAAASATANLPAVSGTSALLAANVPQYVKIGAIVFASLAVVVTAVNLYVVFHGSGKSNKAKKSDKSENYEIIITTKVVSDYSEEDAVKAAEEVTPEATEKAATAVAEEEAAATSEEPAEAVEEPVEEPVEQAEEAVEEAVEEPAEEGEALEQSQMIAALEEGEVEESESGAVVHNTDGTYIYLMYNKSFTAKLIQAKDEVRDYYNVIKNHALSYKKVTARISWRHESINRGRDKIARLVLRGKSLYLYLPLNPDDYAETKYKVENAEAKRFEELPCLYRIKNPRRAKYACELIDVVMERYGLVQTENPEQDFVAEYPYEETLPLIKRGLIKVTRSNRGIVGSDALEESEKYDKEVVEEVVEEAVIEEAAATEEAVEEEAVEESVFVAGSLTEVRVQEAQQLMTDEQANAMVIQGARKADKTKKGIINIDVLSRFFNNGETVTVEEIKKRVKNFDKKVTYIKVLARGALNKRLTVEADEFSVDAEKMILLMGGTVVKTIN